jgi:hypothetical protein
VPDLADIYKIVKWVEEIAAHVTLDGVPAAALGGTPLVNPDRLAPRFIGQSRSLVPRRILRTCRENIAYNTLPYNFSRLLPLPNMANAMDRALRMACRIGPILVHHR